MSNGYLVAASADLAAIGEIAEGFGLDIIAAHTISDRDAVGGALAGAANVGIVLSMAAAREDAFVALVQALATHLKQAQLILVEPDALRAFAFLPALWPTMPIEEARARASALMRTRQPAAEEAPAPEPAPALEPAPEPAPKPVPFEPEAPAEQDETLATPPAEDAAIRGEVEAQTDAVETESFNPEQPVPVIEDAPPAEIDPTPLAPPEAAESAPKLDDADAPPAPEPSPLEQDVSSDPSPSPDWQTPEQAQPAGEAAEAAPAPHSLDSRYGDMGEAMGGEAMGGEAAHADDGVTPPAREASPEPVPEPNAEAPADENLGLEHSAASSGEAAAEPVIVAAPAPAAQPAPAETAPAAQPARKQAPSPAGLLVKDDPARAAPGPDFAPADASAFAPKKLRRGEAELVRIAIHQPKDLQAVIKAARKADPRTTSAPQSMPLGKLIIGVTVGVALEVKGAACDGTLQRRIWKGEPLDFSFAATADAEVKQVVILARVFIDDAQIGVLAFTRGVTGPRSKALPDGERVRLKRHKRVFLSYSSKDRETVSSIATAYAAAGVAHFWDRASLKSGEEWSPRLRREIDGCDLFHLCWSKAAAQSQWVEKEAGHALSLRRSRKRPDITVQMLDGPPWAKHPDSLDAINFDDFVRAAIVGYARGDGEG